MTDDDNPAPPRERLPARRVLVVGCGYLGRRLAARLAARGADVHGLVRTPASAAPVAATGAVPIVADVADRGTPLPALPVVDTVVWSVGFDRSAGHGYRDVHVLGLGRVLDALPGNPRAVLVSSTGVWGRGDGPDVDETTPAHPDREAGRVLLEAEALLHGHRLGPGTVLRLAGIYGPGRLPRLESLRAGEPIAADPDSWLNLVHVDDAASIVIAVADHPAPGPLYVVSDGRPILRRDWYGRLAALTGSPAPAWIPPDPAARGGDKRVDPRRLFAEIGPHIAHPDALAALAGIPGMIVPEVDAPPPSHRKATDR